MAVSIRAIGMADVKYKTHEDKQDEMKAKIQRLRNKGEWPKQ